MDKVTQNERRVLSVVGFLLLRMGQSERSASVYDVLADISDGNEKRSAQTGLAAALLDLKRPQEALEVLQDALRGKPLTTREAPIALLKARALWQQGRREEAQNWRDQYLYLTGQKNEGHREK